MKKIIIVLVVVLLIIIVFFAYKYHDNYSQKTVTVGDISIDVTKEDLSDDITDEFVEAVKKSKKTKPSNNLDQTCWSRGSAAQKEVVCFSKLTGKNTDVIIFYNFENNILLGSSLYQYKISNNELLLADINTGNTVSKEIFKQTDSKLLLSNKEYQSDKFSNYEIGE